MMTDEQDLWKTNVPGLDLILGGGLKRRALALVVGAPGAGKTVLASNILFQVAKRNIQTLVFTSYSEGNEQYLDHMSKFGFFDRALIGGNVPIFSLQSQLTADEGSPASAIVRIIRSTKAEVVLIDGFQGLAPLLEPGQNLRMFLATLSTQLRYLNVTLLLTIAGDGRSNEFHASITIADIAIGLQYTVQGRRHQRFLEVIKQRGQRQLSGLHSYAIESSGMQIFPRIEVYPRSETQPHADTRAPFGLAELDAILGGGPNTGTTTLLAGAPGVGKTTLGLFWGLAEARPDARTVIITFGEFPEQLQRKASAFGIDLYSAIATHAVTVIRVAAAELDVDVLASRLLAEIATGTVKRFVCDEMGVLLRELGERTRNYISALNDLLYNAHITTLYLLEIPAFEGMRVHLIDAPLGLLGDNMVIIQQYEAESTLRRILAVVRMRLSFFDRTLRELLLDENGVRVVSLDDPVLRLMQKDLGAPGVRYHEQSDSPTDSIDQES